MANTTTGQQAFFKVAEDVGLIHSAFIRTVGSQTSLTCTGLSLGENQTFAYGLARVFGKGIRQITAYREADDLVTLASAFDSNVAVGEPLEVAFFDPIQYQLVYNAVNEAIRTSYPTYYREVKTRTALTGTVACPGTTAVTGTNTRFMDELTVGDVIKIGAETGTVSAIASQTALTLSSALTATTSGVSCYYASGLTWTTGTHQYLLPSTVHKLLAVGYALSADDPVQWIPPLSTWRVIGTEGAFTLDLKAGVTWAVDAGSVSTAYANPIVRGGTIADAFNNFDIELYYVTREPELTSGTDVTNLPLQYFEVASEVYAQRRLMMVNPETPEGIILGNYYGLLEKKAKDARSWLYRLKPPLATLEGPSVELR